MTYECDSSVKDLGIACVCVCVCVCSIGASGKESACQCRRDERCRFNPWVGKIPRRRERLPTPVFWSGEFHGLDSPLGRKESDTTEHLSLSLRFLKGMRLLPSQNRITRGPEPLLKGLAQ